MNYRRHLHANGQGLIEWEWIITATAEVEKTLELDQK